MKYARPAMTVLALGAATVLMTSTQASASGAAYWNATSNSDGTSPPSNVAGVYAHGKAWVDNGRVYFQTTVKDTSCDGSYAGVRLHFYDSSGDWKRTEMLTTKDLNCGSQRTKTWNTGIGSGSMWAYEWKPGVYGTKTPMIIW